VQSWEPWNSWGIALFVCLAIDVLAGARVNTRWRGGARSSSR
jgi:hypothetical protein